jgi:26S proteasome non-ATPase regulatory subunit 9
MADSLGVARPRPRRVIAFDLHLSLYPILDFMGFMLPSSNSPAEKARALISHKEALESELDAQRTILTANNSTLSTPLVDADGFPRADIDVWAVRHARVRIIELRNDLQAVMDEIGKALQGVYDPSLKAEPTAAQTQEPATEPFARVDGVLSGSPAASAVRFPYLTVTLR